MSIVDDNFDLYFAHRRELVDYASAIVGDRSRGEDVVQEAFLRLRSPAIEHPIAEPLRYLRRIVRNLALDWTRRLSLERRIFENGAETEAIAEDRPGLERQLASREDLGLVYKAMSELPERTRIALELHRFEGWKLKDIAQHLGISTALAHTLVYEGLDHCRRALAKRS
ncbi:sigma-70 family RNA polymerase sigma factor [Tardiphaga alba]|uniref:sigma-70 family RNA polymerase sigma factor n=1 Tax=Tardiphaga alba TaxID=340268 RepID=UPI001BA4DFC4|nr:sigma-70 family RNA polymerase sigma factor [Tardiphaga alba]